MSFTGDDKRWIAALLDQRLTEQRELIERVGTALLTEFHKWASPTEARLRTHPATLRAIDLEMEALNERMKRLEGDAA